jgi:hypothetical protein
MTVTSKSKLAQLSAPGGGYAISIIEIKNISKKRLSKKTAFFIIIAV